MQTRVVRWAGMQLLKRDPDPLFDAFPGLETERLLLRRLLASDAADLFAMLGHVDLARFTGRKPLKKLEDAIELLRGVGLTTPPVGRSDGELKVRRIGNRCHGRLA